MFLILHRDTQKGATLFWKISSVFLDEF